jgi:ZIP family zinc transporter
MGAALLWGSLSAFSLVLGALLALARPWPKRLVGLVLALGAGALISAVSFEFAQESNLLGDRGSTAAGLAAGALVYYWLDGVVARIGSAGRGRSGRASGSDAGTALALGAFLDGIPEQMVLGIGLTAGEGVSVGLLVAIFVSNLPEASGSASEMRTAGRDDRTILRLWLAVATVCALAGAIGYALAAAVSDNLQAAIEGFAAGALLVMLVDPMIPEATEESGRTAGLVTTLGFAGGSEVGRRPGLARASGERASGRGGGHRPLPLLTAFSIGRGSILAQDGLVANYPQPIATIASVTYQLPARTRSGHWRHIHGASRGVHHGSTSAKTRGSTRPTDLSFELLVCRDFSTCYARLAPRFIRRSTTHNREVGGSNPPGAISPGAKKRVAGAFPSPFAAERPPSPSEHVQKWCAP